MHRRWAGLVSVAVAAVIVLAACTPDLELESDDGRDSQVDAVDVAIVVHPDGSLRVREDIRFASRDGGTIELPAAIVGSPLSGGEPGSPITLPPGLTLPPGITLPNLPDFLGGETGVTVSSGVSNLTVEGRPATAEPSTFGPAQLRVDRRRARVEFDLTGAVDRFGDIAVLDLPVLPAPDGATRQDPDVDLSGSVRFRVERAPGDLDPHLYAGRNREVTVDGSVVRFSSDAPIWFDGTLVVGFDPGRVPDLPATGGLGRAAFEQQQRLLERAARQTEDTLDAADTSTTVATWLVGGIAVLLPAIFWVIVGFQVVRAVRGRTRDVGPAPEELREPPTAHDPAVVAALWGEGKPDRTAVAGTVLALAQRKALTIEEHGGGARIVVRIPLTEMGTNPNENIVLHALREHATDEGVLEGPPLFPGSNPWWRSYRGAAIRRARSAGFVKRWLPLGSLSGALVTTAVGIGIWFFSRPVVYVTMVVVAEVIGIAISLVGGWTLTPSGHRNRALWSAFKRYIDNHGELADVGPSGVVMWGPYLVYGVVVGEAKDAARPLTP